MIKILIYRTLGANVRPYRLGHPYPRDQFICDCLTAWAYDGHAFEYCQVDKTGPGAKSYPVYHCYILFQDAHQADIFKLANSFLLDKCKSISWKDHV